MSIIKPKGLAESKGDVSYKVIPAGIYPVRITKVEDQYTKEDSKYPKSLMWNFHCKVQSDDADVNGHPLFVRLLLPNEDMPSDVYQMCVDRLKHFSIACGLNVTEEVDSEDFISCEFNAVVTTKTYQGTERNDVKDQLPL